VSSHGFLLPFFFLFCIIDALTVANARIAALEAELNASREAWDGDCYRWCGDDEVNDRPVGKPQEEGMMNIAASFSLSKKPRFVDPVGKRQTQEGDAC
jgi:hypothetical protein